jgi:adenylylsulfate kinase
MKKTIWITGLSGAGKSTIGREVVRKLRNKGQQVVYLDGDELREVFGATHILRKNHNRDARLTLSKQYSNLCHVLSEQGMIVVIATISMFKEVHEWNRGNLSNYFEVFLKVPVEILRQRDHKGIYRRYDAGELKDVAGLDLKIDEPSAPDLVFDYTDKIYKISEVVEHIILENNTQ